MCKKARTQFVLAALLLLLTGFITASCNNTPVPVKPDMDVKTATPSTQTPPVTPNPAPGSTRVSPLPMGRSLLTPEGIEVRVVNMVSGDQAWNRIRTASQSNSLPAADMQYVLLVLRIKNISTEKEPWTFTDSALELVGSSNRVLRSSDKTVVMFRDGNLARLNAELYRGGEATGTIVFYIPRQETNLILAWRGTDDTRTFFELKTVLSASFSASPVRGPQPLRVQFTDISTGDIDGWKWDFGDGSSSTVQNPSKTYENPGSYAVKLTIKGPAGTQQTDNLNINITESVVTPTPSPSTATPVADFSALPVSGNRPLRVQFSDRSRGNITGWKWDFGDGSTSTTQNPSRTYETSGLYAVKLTVSGPSGTASRTSNIIVNDPVVTPPPATPTPTPTPTLTPTPTPAPAIPDVSGNWHGTLWSDRFAVTDKDKNWWQWTMNISQSGSRVSGVFQYKAPDGTGIALQGFSGTISSSGKLSFSIGPSWRMNFDATVNGDRLEGVFFESGTGRFGGSGKWVGTSP